MNRGTLANQRLCRVLVAGELKFWLNHWMLSTTHKTAMQTTKTSRSIYMAHNPHNVSQ
jgi:hypothetical protein